MAAPRPPLDPSVILQSAFCFWSSKVALAAVKFDVFTRLGQSRITGAELGGEMGLHPPGINFLDARVAMKVLGREGDGAGAKCPDAPAGALYLGSGRSRHADATLAGTEVALSGGMGPHTRAIP